MQNKEDLIEYKELLQKLKTYKLYRNISAAFTILSTISFIHCARSQELKQLAISALIVIIGINATTYNNKEANYTKMKILKMKE